MSELNINDIQKLMIEWNSKTYEEELYHCCNLFNIDSETKKICLEVLKAQNLTTKQMNGFSVEKLPYKNEGHIRVIFTKVFAQTLSGYFSPCKYILDMIKECKVQNTTKILDIAGIVGRGLRSFPSFIREIDLLYKVSNALPKAICTREDPDNDVHDHTDVLVKYNERIYRLWSYQNSFRGLDNTSSRLLEYRGSIPFGIHVLCPFDGFTKTAYEEKNGWRFYTATYINKVVTMIKQNSFDSYSHIRLWNENQVKNYMKEIHIFKKELLNKIDMTEEAKNVINCIYEGKERLGFEKICEILLGTSSDGKHYRSYNKISHKTKNDIYLLTKEMITLGYIEQTPDYNHILKLKDFSALKNEATHVLVPIY